MSQDDLQHLLGALGLAAFRRVAADRFAPLGTPPEWVQPLLAAADEPGLVHLSRSSFFLEHFLQEAEEFWAQGADGALPSCTWSEPALRNAGDDLQATALASGGRSYLVITPAGKTFAEHRAILQQARQGQLQHEALMKEIEKKEVLVHCIVHDLANPLSGILGSLQLLQLEPLSAPIRRVVALAVNACQRQHQLIRQILDVFAAEAQQLETVSADPRHAADLAGVAREALENSGVTYGHSGVGTALDLFPEDPEKNWRIIGERTRLERIFANLLENALRHSPRGSAVIVQLRRDGSFAEACIEDAGSGVPEEAIPHLFKKLAPSTSGVRGKAGLGLYFCRITVERWGGEIGYRRGSRGGACFWFRVKLLEP